MNTRILSRVVPLTAVAAVVVGLVVVLQSAARPATFGWFAYAPLSDETGTLEGMHVLSTAGVVGAIVLVLGLVVLAFWAGLRWGGRRSRSHTL